MSIATIRLALAMTAPWMALRPTPPSPNTATVAPGRIQHGADPGGDAAAEQAHLFERRLFADPGQRDFREHGVFAERRRTHVVENGLAVE